MTFGMILCDHDGTGILEVQRDDELDRFANDDAAWGTFVFMMKCGEHPYLLWAEKLLNNWRPYMAETMRGEYGPKLNSRELGTVLAALRYWQTQGIFYAGMAINEIASDGGMIEPLTAAEIDDLCERLNQ